jgi:hypothetical protein
MVEQPGGNQGSLLELILTGSRCNTTMRACLRYYNDEDWEELVAVVEQAIRSGRFYVSIGRQLIRSINDHYLRS